MQSLLCLDSRGGTGKFSWDSLQGESSEACQSPSTTEKGNAPLKAVWLNCEREQQARKGVRLGGWSDMANADPAQEM